MREILPELKAWSDQGDRVALATVVGGRRTAPRPPGGKMAVNHRGEIAGSVSGGCVEGAVVGVADQGATDREETALSMRAEIVAARPGRDGGRLKHSQGRIHEVGVE